MSKILRATQKQFGLNGDVSNFGQFGSLAADSIVTTKDPAAIQALAAWLLGWSAAVIQVGNEFKVPAIQDMNSCMLLAFRQVGYILQQGMPEWDAGTTYYENSYVQVNGTFYRSLTDDNVNNNPATDVVNWQAAPNAALPGSLYGGKLSNNAVDPTFRLNFSATQAKDSSGLYLIESAAMNKSITGTWVAGNGQNGLDTGSIGSSPVLVYCYAIGDRNGIEPGDYLYSKSASSPTLPDGYNLKRLLGCRRWNGTGFDQFMSVGSGLDRWTYYLTPQELTTTLNASFTDLSCASYVPAGVCQLIDFVAKNQQSGVAGVQVFARVKGSTAPIGALTIITSDHDDQFGPGNPDAAATAQIALNESGVFQYATGQGANFSIALRGYMESL